MLMLPTNEADFRSMVAHAVLVHIVNSASAQAKAKVVEDVPVKRAFTASQEWKNVKLPKHLR